MMTLTLLLVGGLLFVTALNEQANATVLEALVVVAMSVQHIVLDNKDKVIPDGRHVTISDSGGRGVAEFVVESRQC